MRTRGFAWLCGLPFALTALPTWADDPATHDSSSAALIALEHKWVEALERSDIGVLSAMLAESYVDTDETGHRSDKAGVLAVVRSGALKMRRIQLSDMKSYVYGNAAVVTGAAAQDGTYEGQTLAPRIVFTDTFVRKGGTWMVVSSQRTAPQ